MTGGIINESRHNRRLWAGSKLKLIIGLAAAVTMLAALIFSRAPGGIKGHAYDIYREAAKINIMVRTWGWETLESEHFLVRHKPGGKEGALLVLAAAEKFYFPVADEFGYSGRGKIPIIVYPSREELNASFGWPASESAMGVYWGGVIRVLSPEVWIPESENTAAVFMDSGPMAHELTHLVVDYITKGNYTRWFTEGVAQYHEYKLTGFLFAEPGGGLGQELYRLREMNRGFDALPNQALAYRQSLSAVEYIVEFYGEDSMHRIIRELGLGRDLNQAFRQVLGIDLAEFEREWHLWLREIN
jgi:hypothetical protein